MNYDERRPYRFLPVKRFAGCRLGFMGRAIGLPRFFGTVLIFLPMIYPVFRRNKTSSMGKLTFFAKTQGSMTLEQSVSGVTFGANIGPNLH